MPNCDLCDRKVKKVIEQPYFVMCLKCNDAVVKQEKEYMLIEQGYITKAQNRVLEHIKSCITETGIAPSHGQMAKNLGYTSTNAIRDFLFILEREGCIEIIPKTRRGIVLTGKDITVKG